MNYIIILSFIRICILFQYFDNFTPTENNYTSQGGGLSYILIVISKNTSYLIITDLFKFASRHLRQYVR